MNQTTQKILKILYDREYCNAKQLADMLQVSERTIRNKIKDARLDLKDSGIIINAKTNSGYYLDISSKKIISQLLKQETKDFILPDNKENRILFIILMLLWYDDYVKFEHLNEVFYVSNNTLSLDFKQIEKELKEFNLTLDRRPNYGIKIIGSEFNKRSCFINFLQKDDNHINKNKELLDNIANILNNVSNEYNIYIPTDNFKYLVILLHVVVTRQQHNHFIKFNEEEIIDFSTATNLYTLKIAKSIMANLDDIKDNEDELLYLVINLNGKIYPKDNSNQVINDDVDILIDRMYEVVLETSGYDLSNDEKLRNDLRQHIIPLKTRMKYNIVSQNPILDAIKTKYSYAYIIASNACRVLNQYFNKELSQDEIGYFAIFFALSLERNKVNSDKKNIVVVCGSGRATSKLLVSKCEKYFGKYINHIYECNLYELDNFDFIKNNISFVFSTVIIKTQLPVAVFTISPFLDEQDFIKYKGLFKESYDASLMQFFDPNLFMFIKDATDKQQVLEMMCNHLAKYKNLDDQYYQQVLERENTGITDFGNLVAIPHAIKPYDNKYAMVAILDKPIFWGHNDVQIVFLVSLPGDKDNSVDQFCKMLLNFQANRKYINQVLETKTYENLITVLFKAYKEN